MKLVKLDSEEIDNLIESKELDNDILFRKYRFENTKILVKPNELVLLSLNGKIIDGTEYPGTYFAKMELTKENNWKNINIKNAEKDGLSIIFLNRNIIKDNKFYIKEKVKYKINKKNKSKDVTIKGKYDFWIENPSNFLNKVIGLRNHFSKQELIERTREYINSSIREKITILFKNNDVFVYENYSDNNLNEFDKKLFEYGICIKKFEIESVEKL